jgi:hypothetical protein
MLLEFRGNGFWSQCLRLSIITLASLAFAEASAENKTNAASDIPVDLELVIALDVSTSMDREERLLQRDGFAAAFRDADILRAILSGPNRRIAVTFTEWAGTSRQNVILEWSVVSDATSAAALADRLQVRIPGRLPMGTSIGDAMRHAASLFHDNGHTSQRRVIDISGDGINNSGPDPALIRDALVAQGITINGLPITYKPLLEGVADAVGMPLPPHYLIDYFSRAVIGGAGSFVEPVPGIEEFGAAIRRKLLREIRGSNEVAALQPGPLHR